MKDDVLEIIRRDIADFADPSTPVTVSTSGASWTQGRSTREVQFEGPESGHFPVIVEGAQRWSYREFFATDRMADLRGLAESILLTLSDVPAYRAPSAKLDDGATSAEPADARATVETLCAPKAERARTNVLFLRGAAGAGKTAFLRHLTIRGAKQYVEGRSPFLYFYIDAQGRALARLDEAIALILQDLRARFTYHAVAALTRMGLLVPIIDGFDELLGAGGYDEAFSSLARFLARLDGQGALVASARATFYQYSNFPQVTRRLGEASRGSINFEITPVDVLPWNREDALAYAEERTATGGVVAKVGEFISQNAELLSTPFFLAQLVDLLTAGEEASTSDHLTILLVRGILRREVDKLRGPDGEPLLNEQQHSRLLELIAEEMWWLGTREVDVSTLRTVAELACDEFGLGSSAARIVEERISSHAMLAAATQPNLLRFQHEYYLAFFQARLVVNPQSDLARVLGRSILGPVVADEAARALTADVVQRFISRLNGTRTGVTSRDAVQANLGALVAGLVRVHGSILKGTAFTGAVFDQVDLHGSRLEGVTFRDCNFIGPDLSSSSWTSISFDSSPISRLRVDARTRLDNTSLRVPQGVASIVARDEHGQDVELFAPQEVTAALRRAGAKLDDAAAAQRTPAGERRLKALRKFMRMARKVFRFSVDDLEICGLKGDSDWDWLRDRLMAEGLLVRSTGQSRRGPTSEMLQLTVRADDLLAGEAGVSNDAAIRRFWETVNGADG
ncbi:MAG: hypothetical protein K0R38_6946 [Polyangiaceae bacterium]|jgi:hypothetical protein|nr:hypothetical protein [Polyangiaceae bacterium]